ncbi:MAG: 3-isopropylmalate dehydratase small subunit, partial [Oscillospiraceae bacterium]|nr:3-isopropylmalate dehydratase small subunit [Oscillospiraceae bacterium]
MKAFGKVHKYGDNVDTDVIIPARYLNSADPKELAQHCMEDIDKDFVNNVKEGDIMVAVQNFGCGSSREHAPLSIKASGISCVIASTFARIFYRKAINIGLPI